MTAAPIVGRGTLVSDGTMERRPRNQTILCAQESFYSTNKRPILNTLTSEEIGSKREEYVLYAKEQIPVLITHAVTPPSRALWMTPEVVLITGASKTRAFLVRARMMRCVQLSTADSAARVQLVTLACIVRARLSNVSQIRVLMVTVRITSICIRVNVIILAILDHIVRLTLTNVKPVPVRTKECAPIQVETTPANVRTVTKDTTANRILMGARLILVKTVAHAGTVLVTSAVSAAWDSRALPRRRAQSYQGLRQD